MCFAVVAVLALLVSTAFGEPVDKLGKIDFLKAATDFADCMIKYGRDRYGKTHSPLFSNILTREKEPRTTPCPRFAELSAKSNESWAGKLKEWSGPKAGYYFFHKFDFNKILNYPKGLGGEGPHKVTLYGCDPYEDRQLYYMLLDLTRITGKQRFKAEAVKALKWWFANTQGPSGLYPWGEHLGWDFQHECPTYFEGPSKHLYAACYHEIKDRVPFLDFLAALPAPEATVYRQRFTEAMDDDFNTAQAIAALFDLTSEINRSADEGHSTKEAQSVLMELAGVLGFSLESRKPTVDISSSIVEIAGQFGINMGTDEPQREASDIIEQLIEKRVEYRQAREWALADKIRAQLAELGIILEDTSGGTTWRHK